LSRLRIALTDAPTALAHPGTPPGPITAVGVVVPARDEADGIGRCLGSILVALEAVAAQTVVCVVLDRCTDRSAEIVATLARDHPSVVGLSRRGPATVGQVRNRGVRRVRQLLGRHPASGTWLLSTDADTTVTPGWVRDHLAHAAAGAHAVAGLADLDDPTGLSADARDAYARILSEGTRRDGHTHVYGANLGIRADVFDTVGGFPSLPHGEDHGLITRVREHGFQVTTALNGRVRTSARTGGRAPGGLADLLADL
jgi:glycosyltransferase involved in cell wall biosynthesis